MEQAISLPADSPPEARPGRDRTAEVMREQVRLAYANLPVSQAVAVLNGLVLAIVLSFAIDRMRLGIWLAALVGVTVARMVVGVQFRRSVPSAEAMPRWRAYYQAGAMASGMVWGSTAMLFPPDSIVHQVFVAFVVGGMVVGAVVAITPMFTAFLLFAACALLPIIGRYLLAGDAVHYAMAVMGSIFLVAMIMLGKRMHDTMSESLELRFENRELIDYLTGSRKHLVAANADLVAAQKRLTRANEALESRVVERTAALQAADRRKDEFLAVLSHELRNPLAPISNCIYILNRFDSASEQGRRARDIIERQTQHITRLVDDLLDVTRIARGKIELRREPTDLTELLRRTVQDYTPLFQQIGIELATQLPDVPVWASVDPTRIAQLVGNLLQNASKFTPRGGRVVLRLQVLKGCGEIQVSDTGAGISPDLLPALFEPFMQGKQSLARTEGGLGLGLALVKGIIALHDGTVQADSDGAGKGATFTVRWPLGGGEIVPVQASSATQEETRRHNVLVVDDNTDAADSLAELVRMFGHRAEVAYDGRAALEKAYANRPDVLLCDLGLPGLTGYEVARALRAQHTAIRMIAVSGYAQPEDIAGAADAGFERHIAKPLDPEIVRDLLK